MIRPPARSSTFAVIAALVLVTTSSARAQEDDDDDDPQTMIDRWADSVAASLAPRWVGPRVPWPDPEPRPPHGGTLSSELYPVHVHASSEAATPEQLEQTLAALEHVYAWMEENRWPTPVPDGGYDRTAGFDLYLVDDVGQPSTRWADEVPSEETSAPIAPRARASIDAPLRWGGLDGAVVHARMDVAVDPERIEACAISAFVRASLYGADPAEAESWRIATGDYVAWLLTGYFGCSDDGLVRHQRESWRTWIGDAPDSGYGGALFLAMLSARTDGLKGSFIRDLWSGAPQLTWEGEGLRAAPDMWQVLNTVMARGEDPLARLIEEMAIARWFVGPPERDAGAPMVLLHELPDDAVTPIAGHARWEDLPRRFEPHDLELEPYGTAYLTVDTSGAPAGSVLRIWLRGEFGAAWALGAVRLHADGTEGGRVRAPVRPTSSRSYIPLELIGGDTAKVVVAVTNLGARLVDADAPDDQARAFRVIFDRVGPGGP